MSEYDNAVNKRRAHNSASASSNTSILDWAKEGVNLVSHYTGVAKDVVKDQLEKVAPSDPEARIQKEVVSKVNRDELIQQFESAGRAFGSKVATAAGTTGSAAWAFLKSATGQISTEAKTRLESLDQEANEDVNPFDDPTPPVVDGDYTETT